MTKATSDDAAHAAKEQAAALVSQDSTPMSNPTNDNAMEIDNIKGDAAMEVSSLSTEATSSDSDTRDLIDLKKLCRLLSQIHIAAKKIAGKDVLLFFGDTGAGKTTTTLYLAGAKFNEVEVGGEEHYEPYGISSEVLAEFAVSGSATSVTSSIHATTVSLPSGEPITICDTPGFGDTKGPEMEISNGLGIIHALKQAKSVKPVLLVRQEGMSNGRFACLRKTLQIIVSMMGQRQDFSTFEYVFSRCDHKKSKKVHSKLAHFQASRNEGNQMEEHDLVLDALLSDMIEKTKPEAIYIDPEDTDAAPEKLEQLWCGNKDRLDSPKDAFQEFVSEESSNKLSAQVSRMLLRMDKALKSNYRDSFKSSLQQLIDLAEVLPLPQIEDAVKEGLEMGQAHVHQARSQISSLVARSTDITTTEGFKNCTLELQQSLEAYLQLEPVYTLCRRSTEDSPDTVVQATRDKVFKGLQGQVSGIQDVSRDLQSILLRINHAATVLSSIKGDATKFQALVDTVMESVYNLVKSRLVPLEQKLENASSQDLAESKDSLRVLLEFKTFLEKSTSTDPSSIFNDDQWFWFMDKLKEVLIGLEKQSEEYSAKLSHHIHSLAVPDDFESQLACPSLSALDSDDEVVQCRAFLSVLSSCSALCDAIKDPSSEGAVDSGMLLAHFDDTLSDTMVSFAAEAHSWAGKKHSHSDKKKAEKLLDSVEAALNVCGDYQEPIDKTTADNVIETKGRLKTFIEKCNSMPQRPDELLYGPEVLGKQFYNWLLKLRAYKIQHGHCDVKRSCNDPKGLGVWVAQIRCSAKKYGRGEKAKPFPLNDKKIEALADLDFEFRCPKDRR